MLTPDERTLWPHTGAVLAGGQSRRMGTPKEAVPLWDGRPMIAHVLDPLAALCRRVVVVGACTGLPQGPGDSVVCIEDRQPGAGPLAGLQALLASALDSVYLVAACDQPLLTPDLLRRLTQEDPARPCFFRAEDGRELDPFPGYFPASWLPVAEEALRSGERSVRRTLRRSAVSWVMIPPEEEHRLKSVNTPEELAALRAAEPSGRG